MTLYFNRTRFDAIVTINVTSVVDPKESIKVGIESAMKVVDSKIGIHDIVVGPGLLLEVPNGIEAQFLAIRNAP